LATRHQRLLTAILGFAVAGAGFGAAVSAAEPRKTRDVRGLELKLMWEGTVPTQRSKRIPALKAEKQALVPFKSAPFPYDGTTAHGQHPFLDVVDAQGRRGRTSARSGGTLWEDRTFSDNRVLLHMPKGFSLAKPAVMVVFLHGNHATLERDVMARQRVPRQVADARINAILVAPQFAVDAADSSAGHFWEPGAFKAFLAETAVELARLHGHPAAEKIFRRLPIILIAYSGGYQPAAHLLHHGGAGDRIRGVAIFDGLYGEQEKFADWIAHRRNTFFVSAYTPSSASGNAALRKALEERDIQTSDSLDNELAPGSVTFPPTDPETTHGDFVTKAWTANPITDLLARASLHIRPLK
jgi:hypothetical protein